MLGYKILKNSVGAAVFVPVIMIIMGLVVR